MSNWWDNRRGRMVNREQDWASQRFGIPATGGDRRATLEQRAGAAMPARPTIAPMRGTTMIPDRLEQAGRAGGANMMSQAPAMPGEQEGMFAGMTSEEILAFILGGGGGGGVNLSGYNDLLADLGAREAALNERRGQQQAFLESLFGAAGERTRGIMAGVPGTIEGQLASDAGRRATEIGLIRGQDASRRETADAARGALGVMPGEDLSSQLSENLVAREGASGSVADRSARIRENILMQQLNRELSGLTPLQQAAMSDLNMGYEDRLSGLNTERSALMAQIAQARASGSRGPSVSEKIAALNFVAGLGDPGPAPEAPRLPSNAQGIDLLNYYSQLSPSNAALYGRVYNQLPSLLEGYALDPATMKPRRPIEITNQIVQANPSLRPAYDFILSLVQRAE
jgi:hypothetical protein